MKWKKWIKIFSLVFVAVGLAIWVIGSYQIRKAIAQRAKGRLPLEFMGPWESRPEKHSFPFSDACPKLGLRLGSDRKPSPSLDFNSCEITFGSEKLFIIRQKELFTTSLDVFKITPYGHKYASFTPKEKLSLILEIKKPDIGFLIFRREDIEDFPIYLMGSMDRNRTQDGKFRKYIHPVYNIYHWVDKGIEDRIVLISDDNRYECVGGACFKYLQVAGAL